eukprot:875752-Pleurochrysis_carterae.AAC.1
MASRTIAPMSILAEPRRVRRSVAACRIWSKTSVSSSTPLARGIDPSVLHARRASSERWKSGAAQHTPPTRRRLRRRVPSPAARRVPAPRRVCPPGPTAPRCGPSGRPLSFR